MIGIKNGVHQTEAPDFILFKKQQFCNIFVPFTTLQSHRSAIRCVKLDILAESPSCFAPSPPKSMLGMRIHGRGSSANIDFGGRGAGDAGHAGEQSRGAVRADGAGMCAFIQTWSPPGIAL